jgi:excisionase family DNA binding protein
MSPGAQQGELLFVKDAAEVLGVTTATVHRLEEERRLRATRTASGWQVFARADVERVKAEREAVQQRRAAK